MKRYFILSILFTVQFFLLMGCDSPSGSKPDPVSRPVLLSPENNATNVPLTPVFKWSGAADVLQIASNPGFAAGDIFHNVNITGQQYHMPANILQKSKIYYWRVGKKSGSTIDWSASIFTFRTIN